MLIEQKINNHIHSKETQRNAILAVDKYCREQGLDSAVTGRIREILEQELHHRTNVDTIYIHPLASDTQMFFGEHFSLSPRKMAQIVKSGFRAAIDVLRKYDFADRPERPAVGRSAQNVS